MIVSILYQNNLDMNIIFCLDSSFIKFKFKNGYIKSEILKGFLIISHNNYFNVFNSE